MCVLIVTAATIVMAIATAGLQLMLMLPFTTSHCMVGIWVCMMGKTLQHQCTIYIHTHHTLNRECKFTVQARSHISFPSTVSWARSVCMEGWATFGTHRLCVLLFVRVCASLGADEKRLVYGAYCWCCAEPLRGQSLNSFVVSRWGFGVEG